MIRSSGPLLGTAILCLLIQFNSASADPPSYSSYYLFPSAFCQLTAYSISDVYTAGIQYCPGSPLSQWGSVSTGGFLNVNGQPNTLFGSAAYRDVSDNGYWIIRHESNAPAPLVHGIFGLSGSGMWSEVKDHLGEPAVGAELRSVNNSGIMVGKIKVGNLDVGTIWANDGSIQDSIASSNPTDLVAINDDGDVLGVSTIGASKSSFVRFQNGELFTFSPLTNTSLIPTSLNNHRSFVANLIKVNGSFQRPRVYLYTGTNFISKNLSPLPFTTDCRATKINDREEIIGSCNGIGVIWIGSENYKAYKLGDLVSPIESNVLPKDLSNNGRILTNSNSVLTPAP